MNTEDINKEVSEIVTLLKNVNSSYSVREAYCDLIDLWVILIGANAKGNLPEAAPDTFQRQHTKYSATGLKQLYIIIQKSAYLIKTTCSDILGRIYMNVGSNKQLQQFFTPDSISELMAALTYENRPEKDNVISDMCVGSGGLILGYIRYIRNQGIDLTNTLFVLNDIDLFCCKMCFIQMSIVGAAAEITCSDALSDPQTEGSSFTGYWLKTPVLSSIETILSEAKTGTNI